MKSLETQEKELLNQLTEIRKKINQERDKKELPALKKKYEGKYFKSVRRDDGTEYSYRYMQCVKVVDGNTTWVNEIYLDRYGRREFRLAAETVGFSIFETPITKREYNRELNRFINLLNQMKQP